MHKTYAGAISLFNDFLRDDYILFVNESDEPISFRRLENDINEYRTRLVGLSFIVGEMFTIATRGDERCSLTVEMQEVLRFIKQQLDQTDKEMVEKTRPCDVSTIHYKKRKKAAPKLQEGHSL